MARPLRTFVALRCGEAARRRLAREAARLAALDPQLRCPLADDLHVTLQFLGDTDEADLGALGRALAEAAATVEPPEVRYGGLGAFPEPARARVVWAGLAPPGDLERLATAVGERLGPLGYPPEARRFHAHVTLGRLRRRPTQALVEAVATGQDLDLGAERLSVLKLILSQPGDRGYRYIDLTSIALGGR